MGATSTKKNQQRLFKGEDENFQRSVFDLGYKNKLTAPFNKLVPTCVKHIMPGDSVHAKTDFFTRWLSLQAPVFADYQMKFANWFIKYTQLWGGFDKFMGEGDSESADYLLDGSKQGKYASQVPYFTSRDLSHIAYNRMYNHSVPSVQDRMIDNYPLHVREYYRKFFKIVLVPVCAFRAEDHEFNHLYTGAPSDWVVGYYQGNDVTESIKNQIILCPMLWRNDSFTQNCIDNQLIFDLDSIPEEQSKYDVSDFITYWSGSNLLNDIASRKPKWAFTYNGTNLPIFRDPEGEVMDFAVYEMGHDCLPLDMELFGCSASYAQGDMGDTSIISSWSSTSLDFDSASPTQYFGLCQNFHFRRLSTEEQAETGFVYSYFVENKCKYQLYGYMRSLSPSELYDYVKQEWQTVTIRELWERTFGQLYVKTFLGNGTLSDYLGLNYEEMALRQPFSLASAIQVSRTYNGDSIAHNPYKYKQAPLDEDPYSYAKNRYAEDLLNASRDNFGNYNRDSAKISVGVVNDVKISCLAFLAYHKAYSDTLRDERYSLRYVYSDPYCSPFLLPLNYGDGDFISGNVFALAYHSSSDKYLVQNSPYFSDRGRDKINTSNVWTEESLVQFFSLQDRRVTQDYFSLMLPTQQMGDPATASVAIDSDGPLQTDWSSASNTSLSVAGSSSTGHPAGEVFGQLNGASVSVTGGLKGSVSVNEIRFAGKLQRFLERSLSAGSSYVKQILVHFGVTPSSSHTQRVMSRYLGGDRFYPTISPVDMVGANDKDSGQTTGSQTGTLSCSGRLGEVSFKSDDHGIFLQLLTIQNEFIVCGNEPSMIDKYDFPMPEFADLPPEAVGVSELVNVDGSDNTGYGKVAPDLTFGYVPRYARHKCSKDQIHGQLRTDLSYWVTPRKFNGNWFRGSFGTGDKNNMPELGENFLFEDPDYSAFVDMTDDNHKCIIDMQHFIKVSRQLPVLPTPRLH